jgi:periplasmic protein TonB
VSGALAAAARRGAKPPRIVDVVLEGRLDRPIGRSAVALAVATAVHVGLVAWATATGGSLEPWTAQLAMRLHEELGRERIVEVTPPPPPKPAPPPERPPSHPEQARTARPTPRRADSRPPPPAQAGQIIAREEGPRAPLDMTGDTFVTGTAQAYAGGVTSSTGTNPHAVEEPEVDPQAPPGEPDRSRRVALVEEGCHTWPAEAEAEPIDQKDVALRIVVRADGSVASARLIGDPGRAFGAAAIECARRSRFSPQLDAEGKPVQTELRFTWHFTR